MKHTILAAAAFALITAPLAAQNAAPPPPSKAGFEQATSCAALETFFSAINAQSSSPDAALQDRLERSAERWLQYAEKLPQQNREAVIERFGTQSEALANDLIANIAKPDDFAAKVAADLLTCNAAAEATFGSSFRDM